MATYTVVIGSRSDEAEDHSGRPLTKLELLKGGVLALLSFAGAIAFLIAASVIGLLLAAPLVLLGLVWLVTLILRGKIRIERHPNASAAGRPPPSASGRESESDDG